MQADKGQMPAGVGALAEYTVARSTLLVSSFQDTYRDRY